MFYSTTCCRARKRNQSATEGNDEDGSVLKVGKTCDTIKFQKQI